MEAAGNNEIVFQTPFKDDSGHTVATAEIRQVSPYLSMNHRLLYSTLFLSVVIIFLVSVFCLLVIWHLVVYPLRQIKLVLKDDREAMAKLKKWGGDYRRVAEIVEQSKKDKICPGTG